MIKSSTIPIFYPLQERELEVHMEIKEGRIQSIHSTLHNHKIEFTKNSDGDFVTLTKNNINPSYLAYVTRQLNRMFGN